MLPRPRPTPGSPEWMVTYADLMSLLLAAFVMLLAVGQDHDQHRTKSQMRAFQERFSRQTVGNSPATSSMCRIVREGRGRRAQVLDGGKRLAVFEAVEAEPAAPRRGRLLHFAGSETELCEEHKKTLDAMAQCDLGPSGVIQLNALTCLTAASARTPLQLLWDRAYARCLGALEYLVEQGVDPQRVRISVAAGPRKPAGGNRDAIQDDASVEVLVLR